MEEPVDHWVSKKAGEEVHYFYEEQGFYKELASPEDLPEGASLIIKEGHLIEKLMEGREYILRETLAPENYVGYETSDDHTKESNREENSITEEVRFHVEGTNLVAEHDLKDQRTVGSFAVTKEGEFLVGTEKSITDQIRGFFTTLFRYLLGRVEQASFEVYVKEDILQPDGTGNYAVWLNGAGELLELQKDTKIETIITDWTGTASIKNLPLGTYYASTPAPRCAAGCAACACRPCRRRSTPGAQSSTLTASTAGRRRRPSPATARRSNPCAQEGGLDGPPFSLYNGA